jgi:hypothetical protein
VILLALVSTSTDGGASEVIPLSAALSLAFDKSVQVVPNVIKIIIIILVNSLSIALTGYWKCYNDRTTE